MAAFLIFAPSTALAISGGDAARRFFKTTTNNVKLAGLLPSPVTVPTGTFFIVQWTLPWTTPAGVTEYPTFDAFKAAVAAGL